MGRTTIQGIDKALGTPAGVAVMREYAAALARGRTPKSFDEGVSLNADFRRCLLLAQSSPHTVLNSRNRKGPTGIHLRGLCLSAT